MLKLEDLVIDKEFEELLPVLTPEEFARLEQNILNIGLLDPIKVWEEPESGRYIIIDGHNRYRIMKKNNLPCEYWNIKVITEKDLKTREDVKRWMLEQQLGRRNLSEVEKYEIIQKFKSVFEEKAKKNQSSGGKGLSNLSKVNTRREMAKATGVSEGTYRKMDKVMQSDNEVLKQRLREKKVSVDAAYKEVKSSEKMVLTPKDVISNVDKKLEEIDKQMESLAEERAGLLKKRTQIFYGFDIKCSVKYRWVNSEYDPEGVVDDPEWKDCQIYMDTEFGEYKLGTYRLFRDYPNENQINAIPEQYRVDFKMAWKNAYEELQDKKIAYEKEQWERIEQALQKKVTAIPSEKEKKAYKKFYFILANYYHPDNCGGGDAEMMKIVNKLKESWGI